MIRSRAPLRISLAGGGTDVSPYAEEYGGAVLSAAINKYAFAVLEPLRGRVFTIASLDDGKHLEGQVDAEPPFDGTADLAKAVIRRLKVEKGYHLATHSDAPWGSGLGTSSTHIVAILGAFSHWLGLGLSLYEIAETAYQIERLDLRLEGGRQDYYSATFGWFNFIEFTREGVLVHPLRIKDHLVLELEYRLLLCFLGRTRMSSRIIQDQIRRVRDVEPESLDALHKTKDLALAMKRLLLKGRLDEMGELLHEGWILKKRFSPLVTTPEIDDIYAEAVKFGALGGKILGAGGGGHMLFFCSPGDRYRLASYLSARGLGVVPFSFESRGLVTWEAAGAW